MTRCRPYSLVLSLAAAAVLAGCGAGGPMASAPAQKPMGFFLTSANPGQGADFGGLPGADRYCQSLAAKAGAGGRTWRAYLSNSALAGSPAVNARDRIGTGPWYNAKGVLVATNLDELHGSNMLTKQSALTEAGQPVMGRGDATNLHDILTGSSPDGRAVSDGKDNTCGNWTKSGDGSAIVGHHDRMGLRDDAPSKSWNSSHASQGCSLDALKKTGGGGLLYCFAVN
ncbi:hypothetical protein ACSFA8_11105 [Variovorax sp. RT4R15]|uniref:hypothetical protein n=1 Tax=Variovorax sp. RT4R15 TaxID=3443737 RepID=UPI003F486D45